MDEILYTYREIARRLGIHPRTVGDIVRSRKIPVRRHPVNGRALAITVEGFKQIEEALAVAAS